MHTYMYSCIYEHNVYMYACMYMCTYVHGCVYVCMCVCVYMHWHTCIHVYMYVSVYVPMYVRTYVRMYLCMCVCMYVCMHAWMYVFMYLCMHVCMDVYTYIYIYLYMSCIRRVDASAVQDRFFLALGCAESAHSQSLSLRRSAGGTMMTGSDNKMKVGSHYHATGPDVGIEYTQVLRQLWETSQVSTPNELCLESKGAQCCRRAYMSSEIVLALRNTAKSNPVPVYISGSETTACLRKSIAAGIYNQKTPRGRVTRNLLANSIGKFNTS